MAISDVAQIREQIAAEYMAAKWGLSGLAYGTSRHTFITVRMENMEKNRKQLADLVGQQQATALLAETLTSLSEYPERSSILDVLPHLLGQKEKTAHLIDWIQDMWETIDLLKKEFGEEGAQKIIDAPGMPVS